MKIHKLKVHFQKKNFLKIKIFSLMQLLKKTHKNLPKITNNQKMTRNNNLKKNSIF